MARSKNIRAKNARPGDVVDLLPGSSLSWLADVVGEMSYEDLKEKWGLIDKNPTGSTKHVICLADLSDTATAPGTPMSGIMEADASDIPEEQINCIWIPIPDNLMVTMKQPTATTQLGPNRDAGFLGLLRKGLGKVFGRGRQEEPSDFAPTQITGLPVPLTSKQDEEPFIKVGESEIIKSPDWRFGDRAEEEEPTDKRITPNDVIQQQKSRAAQQEVIEAEYTVLQDDAYDQDEVDPWENFNKKYDEQVQTDRVLELPGVRGENWEFGDNTPTEIGGPLAIYDPDVELIEEGESTGNGKRKVNFYRDIVGYPEEHLEDLAGKAGEVAGTIVDTGRQLNGARVGRFASRLGGAALSGFHAAAGKALEGTLAGKMLNIETKRLTMLSRVPVGETIMFTVGDDRVGVRRGDRGEVRMGGRGKDKVVYFHDTGEIVLPDQWTMVAITGKVPTPQTGTLGMGLGLFGQPGHYGRSGYMNGRGWTVPKEGQEGQPHWGEFPPDFVEQMLAIPVSRQDLASESLRQILSRQYQIVIGAKTSDARKDLYRRLKAQRDQNVIHRGEDPGPVIKRGAGARIKFVIKKRGPEGDEHGDPGTFYIQTIIPSSRIPGRGVAPRGWNTEKSRAKIYEEDEKRDLLKRWVELTRIQPGASQEKDMDPYVTHTGLVGADDLEASEPQEEANPETLRLEIFKEVHQEAEEEGWTQDEINKKIEERLIEATGTKILNLDFLEQRLKA